MRIDNTNDKKDHMKTEASGKLSFRSLVMRVAGFFVLAWRKMTQGLKRLLGRSPETHRPAADMDMSETQVFGDLAETPHARSARKPRLRHSVPSKYRSVPHISKEHLSGEGKEHINMFQPRRREGGVIIRVLLTSVRLVLIVLFMIAAAGAGVLVGVSKAYMETTPKLDTGKIEDQSETSYIYDSNGELIALYTGSENRDWANLDEIPKYLQEAVIAIEDIRFKYHSGVDIKRLVGAFINNLMNSNVQGGSTITQQLIKNRLLSTERTYKRKIQEAYLALQLERIQQGRNTGGLPQYH